MRVAASVLLMASLLTGCGGGGDSTDTGATAGVELTYHRSGGLAALDETLRTHRSGAASIAVGRIPGPGEARISQVRKFQLSANEAARLGHALAKSGFSQMRLDRTTGCADCFVYELATPANQVRFDESTIPARLEPVLSQLDAIVAANRPGG